MEKWHTIIIGAGPAGLACAEKLAAQSYDVLVLERNRVIGPKVCAGGITGSGLLKELPVEFIERTFHEQHVATRCQKTVLSSDSPIISTVNRKNLGQWMLKKAIAAGASIRTESRVSSISDNKITLNTGEEFEFDFLVGADGSSSIVRKYLNIPTQYYGTGIQYTLPYSMTNMEWHLDNRFFKNGYAWIFPHQEISSVGAYIARGKTSPRELQKSLLAWASQKKLELAHIKPEAGLINFDYRGWHFNNIYLAGDAAGFASGITGEGIFPAVLSGKTVAKSIIKEQNDHEDIDQLIKDNIKHRQLVTLTAKNNIVCNLVMETLVLGLRLGLVDFNAVEMGSC